MPDGPTAIDARVPEGETLCLAVAPTPPGRQLALQQDDGRLHVLETRVEADCVVSCEQRLSDLALPSAGRVALTVVLVTADGDVADPVHRLLSPDTPTRTPPTRDGRWQFQLRERPKGLRLIREPRPEQARVTRLGQAGGVLTIDLQAPPGIAPVLALTRNGEVVDQWDLHAEGAHLQVRLDAASLAQVADQPCPLAVGDDVRRVPLVRAWGDLQAPNAAVVLPEISTEGPTGTPGRRELVRLRWLRDGTLALVRSDLVATGSTWLGDGTS